MSSNEDIHLDVLDHILPKIQSHNESIVLTALSCLNMLSGVLYQYSRPIVTYLVKTLSYFNLSREQIIIEILHSLLH